MIMVKETYKKQKFGVKLSIRNGKPIDIVFTADTYLRREDLQKAFQVSDNIKEQMIILN